jgi:hypothetical protein
VRAPRYPLIEWGYQLEVAQPLVLEMIDAVPDVAEAGELRPG